MELTPQQLTEVEFSEQWRGYNRDQVDDFIERVAAAVSNLQERVRKMTERAVRAEQRSNEGSDADGAARRTLVLAQRTADATIAEAKETAARLVAQAQEEARAIILAAETRAEELAHELPPATPAEPTARAEIADLEVTRSRLQADVAALEAHVNDRRSRIKGLLDELQLRVDQGLESHIAQWPSLAGERILTGETPEVDDDLALGDDEITAPDERADVVDTVAEEPAQDDLQSEPEEQEPPSRGWDEVSFDWERASTPEPSSPSAPEAPDGLETPPVGEAEERQEELAVPAAHTPDEEYPAQDIDDDAFFAELRGALDDDAPLGPRDDAPGTLRWREEAATAVAEAPRLYDQGESEQRKFGLRKRRQRRRG